MRRRVSSGNLAGGVFFQAKKVRTAGEPRIILASSFSTFQRLIILKKPSSARAWRALGTVSANCRLALILDLYAIMHYESYVPKCQGVPIGALSEVRW